MQVDSQNPVLVSVVIPCYNQAHFLSDAIESVLKQTYTNFEIVVVDDGSLDNASEVAARYPSVRCIRQENQGLSAARNTGLQESRGSYLVFLDADDRLLHSALEAGVNGLNAHPECAFVCGYYRRITSDGSPLPTQNQPHVEREHYLALLRRDYIGVPATVMYRRTVFDSVIGFDASFTPCEDFDLYLRITRNFPIHCHDEVVVEYRLHGASMSSNSALMLKTSVAVLRSQWKYVRRNNKYKEAYKTGIRNWQDYYGRELIEKVQAHAQARAWKQTIQGILALLRHHPRGFVKHSYRKLCHVIYRVKS